ncbi:NADH-quinone oxidoreductase subunit N [Lacibacter sediminis]|uniref:NADH-quinone oxidoreductase subunit N n=1 Tax=Lacibacter sediminis TaxID=2760713 RepID=A0A7G5XE55_9BACT|nr:NADH-quinone oxidoreductase subunit N [Lacibacter sediminis]QNA43758.1 NADH-quinone oxidoreductase subunit N [Lacibacter sediminis]
MSNFFLFMQQELLLTAIIFILLFMKLSTIEWKTKNVLLVVNILLTINLVAGIFIKGNGSLFGDMFQQTELLRLEKNILNLGTLLISLQSYNWLLKHKHATEFYLLMLSTLLGMFFMLSSSNLLMFYVGLELASIPLAALANFDLDKRRSSEAAMKYIMSSAFASGLLLFGISMMYGVTGTVSFAELQTAASDQPLFLFSFILILAGFGFKISAVPFHLWTADVYEGSPIAVTSYLSVISKGSMIFAMTTVLFTVFGQLIFHWYNIIAVLAVLSMIVGNLFAIRQQNVKRFLAFSSISQVGFILIGVTGANAIGQSSVIYFVLIYIFSNLAAFGVLSLVSSEKGKETIDDFKGFYKTNPLLTWVLAIALFSLAGIPPTAGFFGKFFLILAGAGKNNYPLITIAALNMVVSLYYYLRIIKAMFMDANETPIEKVEMTWAPKLSMAICVAGIVITGIASGAYEYIYSLVK